MSGTSDPSAPPLLIYGHQQEGQQQEGVPSAPGAELLLIPAYAPAVVVSPSAPPPHVPSPAAPQHVQAQHQQILAQQQQQLQHYATQHRASASSPKAVQTPPVAVATFGGLPVAQPVYPQRLSTAPLLAAPIHHRASYDGNSSNGDLHLPPIIVQQPPQYAPTPLSVVSSSSSSNGEEEKHYGSHNVSSSSSSFSDPRQRLFGARIPVLRPVVPGGLAGLAAAMDPCPGQIDWEDFWDGPRQPRVLIAVWLLLGLPFGGHHFYLRRFAPGLLSALMFWFVMLCFRNRLMWHMLLWPTAYWLVDGLRLLSVLRQANAEVEHERALGARTPWYRRSTPRSTYEAYKMLVSPYGFAGYHHVYLGNPWLAAVYFFSFGVFGLGWLYDLLVLPRLVRYANAPPPEGGGADRDNNEEAVSLEMAYGCWLPLGGFIGLHHYYLGRWRWGLVYTATFGLLGVGWLVDGCRMYALVRKANRQFKRAQWRAQQAGIASSSSSTPTTAPLTYDGSPSSTLNGSNGNGSTLVDVELHNGNNHNNNNNNHNNNHSHNGHIKAAAAAPAPSPPLPADGDNASEEEDELPLLSDCYLLHIPCGFFGLPHFYLGNYWMGCAMFFSLGGLGFLWALDLCLMPHWRSLAVRRRLAEASVAQLNGAWPSAPTAQQMALHSSLQKTTLECFYLWWPFCGWLGLHHFYTGRYKQGLLHFFTLGYLFVGWLSDVCRLAGYVRTSNKNQAAEDEALEKARLSGPVVVANGANGGIQYPQQNASAV